VTKETLLIDLCNENRLFSTSSNLSPIPKSFSDCALTRESNCGFTLGSIDKAANKVKRPKLLTKAQSRLPWNNPKRGVAIAPTPKAETNIIGSSVEKCFKAYAPAIRESPFLVHSRPHELKATNSPLPPISRTTKVKKLIRASDNNPYSEWYQYIHDHTEVLGITTHTSVSVSDISICVLNVNSLSDNKLSCILAVLMLLKIDIMVLTDTRHRESACKSFTKQVKSLLGPHTRCLHTPVPHLPPKRVPTVM